MIGYLDEVIRPLALILPKTSGYVKRFKVKDGDKDKNNKLMPFRINDKLLQKYKNIWTKIEDLKNIELNHLPFYDDKYIKTKIKTWDYNVYTNFCSSNVPEDDIFFYSLFNIDRYIQFFMLCNRQVYNFYCLKIKDKKY